MKTKNPNTPLLRHSVAAFFDPRSLLALALFITGASFAAFAVTPTLVQPSNQQSATSTPWSGGTWSVVDTPNPHVADEYFKGVNCTSESDCWAVGHYFFADPTLGVWRTLIEHWDGASWSIVSSPNANTNGDNYLTSITCVSASECWAVGYYSDRPGSQLYRTLTLRWAGGSWSIVSSANTDSAQANLLNGVTCVSASECWAVGYSGSGSENRALIERWDGTSWSIVSSPNIGTG